MLPLQAGISGGAVGSIEMGADADQPVWLCLLGYFRLLKNGQLVAVRSGGKTEALLAHLGLGGVYRVPRDVLLRVIWPHSDTALAAQALNSLVHNLRTLLGDALRGATPVIQTGGHYRRNAAAGVAVDIVRFTTLVSDGERCERAGHLETAVAQYQHAVQLYGGDLSPSFGNFTYGNTAIERVYHNPNAIWHEGPTWSAQGKYLIWSDVVGNVQRRWLEDDGHVSDFRDPSNNANGSTHDFQGRLITCEDFNRRVIRFEPDGSVTVLADNYQGKPLSSPNDIVPHPDGSIWFTDPPYGDQINEGQVDQKGGAANGGLNPSLQGENAGGRTRQLPAQVYRIDPSGSMTVVVTEDQIGDPNGPCFSPEYKTFYVISTGKGPGDTGSGGDGKMYQWDVSSDGKSLSNRRLFTDMMVDGVHCGPDGMRADMQGNLWCSSNGPLGYSGVVVLNAGGDCSRPDTAARSVRQRRLWRIEAESPVHGVKLVALFVADQHPGSRSRLDSVEGSNAAKFDPSHPHAY